jgi:hypothetical protein
MNKKENEESKVISLEEEVEQNFILKCPQKGKIYRGSNWNAYNRESLGSIPRASENILFKDKSKENRIGFSSQTGRFTNRTDSEKYAYPGPGKYTEPNLEEKTLKNLKNVSHSNKGYGGFISTTDRFDSLREYYEKFLPGPSDYKKDQNFIENKVKNSKLFKSLYTFDEYKSIKKTKDLPGPGYYNPIMPISLRKENNLNKENFYFQSKDKQRLPIENATFSPGPARYYINDGNNLNYTNDYHKTSYFFKDKVEKREEPADKYLVQKKYPIRKLLPGPGQYEFKSDLGKLKYDYSNINKKIISDKDREKDIVREKELEEINLLKGIKKEAFMPYISPFENLKKSARSVFLSKSPRDDYLKINHNPGPGYYQPQKQENKVSFNWNSDKIWV